MGIKGDEDDRLCRICRPGLPLAVVSLRISCVFKGVTVAEVTVAPPDALLADPLLSKATCWAGTMRRGWPPVCCVTINFCGPPCVNCMGCPEAVRTVAFNTGVGSPGNPIAEVLVDLWIDYLDEFNLRYGNLL